MSSNEDNLVHISFLPDARLVEALPGQTVLQAALSAGIKLTHACGSNARCSTCRTAVLEGLENCSRRTKAEEEIAAHLQFKSMIRLACQTRVTGSVTVRRLVLDDEDEELAVKSMADQFVEAAGEEKHVAILFVDIRGFTAFAERLLPYDVIHALNRYYHRMGQIVHRHGGVIDNYMGDGILSVFGIEGSDRMVSRALQAGLEMLQAVESMKPYFEAIHGRSFDIGIGLHSGAVVVGTIGWGNYKRRTIVGDAVNFASRVESANKNAGTNFLISEDAYEQVGHEVEVNQCPPWEIRGKTGVFQLYEVVGTKVPEPSRREAEDYLRQLVPDRVSFEITERRLCSAIVHPPIQLKWLFRPFGLLRRVLEADNSNGECRFFELGNESLVLANSSNTHAWTSQSSQDGDPMIKTETGRAARSPAQIYDEFFVPALFQPWTRIVLDAASIKPNQCVLDVACGTGVLACAAADRVGSGGSVVGLDPNGEMLAVAHGKSDTIEWRAGRAEAIPFPDESFDAVVSQFGMMFFENPSGALREMMRVTRPSGHLAVAVCDALEHSPGYAAFEKLLRRLFGTRVADPFCAPFVLGDTERLLALCAAAGIFDAKVTRYDGVVHFASIRSLVSTERACVWTLGGLLNDEQFETLTAESERGLQAFVGNDGTLTFSMPTLIVTAAKVCAELEEN